MLFDMPIRHPSGDTMQIIRKTSLKLVERLRLDRERIVRVNVEDI